MNHDDAIAIKVLSGKIDVLKEIICDLLASKGVSAEDIIKFKSEFDLVDDFGQTNAYNAVNNFKKNIYGIKNK